jgi:hypothetical protein
LVVLAVPDCPACRTSLGRIAGGFTPVIALMGRRDTSVNKLFSTADA